MTDKVVKAKMEQFIALGNELQKEAKRRYGSEGSLFHEADGNLFLMSGDSCGSSSDRQDYIEIRADGIITWGAGAW